MLTNPLTTNTLLISNKVVFYTFTQTVDRLRLEARSRITNVASIFWLTAFTTCQRNRTTQASINLQIQALFAFAISSLWLRIKPFLLNACGTNILLLAIWTTNYSTKNALIIVVLCVLRLTFTFTLIVWMWISILTWITYHAFIFAQTFIAAKYKVRAKFASFCSLVEECILCAWAGLFYGIENISLLALRTCFLGHALEATQ